MVTIRDVARMAGVSAGTVSNVLNRPSYVTAETRQRVRDAMTELDFRPTSSARQFRPGRGRTLGLAVADMGNPFFVDVALAADAEARRLGVGVVIVTSNEDVRREKQNLDLLVQQRVHGIIISPVEEANPRLESLVAQGIPLVYVDRISGDRPCCWVTTDNRVGGRLAAEHLLERGHRRLAFAGGRAISSQVEDRFEGFRHAAEAAGATVERLATSWWAFEDGRRLAEELTATDPMSWPTAIMCANDLIALGLLQELVLREVRIPDQVAIVGFDDVPWAAASTIPVTSVRQERAELGVVAVRLLLEEIQDAETHDHQHVVLQPTLIARHSSASRLRTTRRPG
ncbi:MAG: LacI family DNA-binding transcriptional regulator [Nocardioidaceae bacterium]